MLESLAGIATGGWGPIIGSLVGFAGGVVNKYMAYKVQKLQNQDNTNARAHAKDMAVINFNREKEITAMEIEGRANQTAIDGEIEIEKIDLSNMGLSIGADRAAYLAQDAQSKSKLIMYAMAVVDFVRGMVRPVLTVALVWAALYISRDFLGLLQVANNGGLPVNVVIQLTVISVVTILTLATTAVGYWFGSRPTVLKKLSEVIK